MGHACAPAHAARWGLTHPLLPSCTGLSWADEGPGRGAFFSLPGTLRRQERGPRSSVGSCTVVGEEACHCRHGSSLSPGPPLSCLLCVARVTQGRVASLSLLLSRCTRLLWVVCLFSAPASHARMTPVASPGLFPGIQTRVPKWLRGIRARRRRPLGARPGLRPCPTARASCWGAVCSQARRPWHLPRAVGPSPSQPVSPLLSQPLLPEPRPPLRGGGGRSASPLVPPTRGSPGASAPSAAHGRPSVVPPSSPGLVPAPQPAFGGLLVLVHRAEAGSRRTRARVPDLGFLICGVARAGLPRGSGAPHEREPECSASSLAAYRHLSRSGPSLRVTASGKPSGDPHRVPCLHPSLLLPTLPVRHPHKIKPRLALGLRLWASYLTPLSLGLLGCEVGAEPRSGAGLGVS